MEPVMPLEQLPARVFALEQETALLRQEVEQLARAPSEARVTNNPFLSAAEQRLLSAAMEEMFTEMEIQVQPIGVEKLQELMRAANLEPNELSRGIIEMRNE